LVVEDVVGGADAVEGVGGGEVEAARDAATGELYRHLTLDPTKDYQPFPDRDPRPPRKQQQPEPK
jgi:hypothetical protein